MICVKCGNEIGNETKCPYCGNMILPQGTGYNGYNYQQTPTIIINNNTAPAYRTMSNAISEKSKVVALVLAIFLGCLGIHRFYVGKIGSGIVWLFTGGAFGIGWIYDIIKILSGTFRDGAGNIIKN